MPLRTAAPLTAGSNAGKRACMPIAKCVLLATALLLACGDASDRAPSADPDPSGSTPATARVISLAPSITRIVQALGAEELLVAVDAYSLEVTEVEGVASVGGLYTPDLERTFELRPTLVLLVDSAQQRAFRDALETRGVRVESIAPYTLEEHLESIAEIGDWIGRGSAARATVARIRRELDSIAARAPASADARTSVAMIVEREPLYVVGRGSFVHELIEIAGGRNVFDDLEAPFPQVSLEVLAERAPALLLDTTVVYRPDAVPDLDAVRAFWRRFVPRARVVAATRADLTLPGVHLAESAASLRALMDAEGG